MRVALLSSEVVPFAKTGGLADVAGALPKFLSTCDVDTNIILPLYSKTDRALLDEQLLENLHLKWRGRKVSVPVHCSSAAGVPAYLIESDDFLRPSIYGHPDDHERFAFFSRASLSLLKQIGWQPDVVHGNDWQCGFAMVELQSKRRFDQFYEHTRSLLSIHNLAYQGMFDPADLWWLGFGDQDFLQRWKDSAPRQVSVYIGYAPESLVHQIEAGADIFLMPSLYEPA